MSRPLRFIPPKGIVEVTTRTLQGRWLLKPSPELNDLILGIIGRAQTLYSMVIYSFVFMSNHAHFLLGPTDAKQLSRFMQFVNGNIAREAGRLYDWPAKFWSRRYRAIPVLDEESALARMRYILSHGAKEGLVASSANWPGAHCIAALTRGRLLRGTWINRAEAGRTRGRGQQAPRGSYQVTYDVHLTPLPAFLDRHPDQRQAEYRRIIADIQEQARQANHEKGRTPWGVARVRGQPPDHRPAAPARSPAPFVHSQDRARAEAFRLAYLAFATGHSSGATFVHQHAHRFTQAFPEGAFPPALPFVGEGPLIE